MATELECKACKQKFTLTKAQQKLYDSQHAAKQPVALTCPLCGRTSLITFTAKEQGSIYPQFRCPVSHCSGWVDHIEEKKGKAYWGCGGCGSQWFDVDNLFNEIAAIQNIYPYRRKCYKLAPGNTWLPVPLEKQLKDYEAKVEQEPVDERDDFVRG